MGSTPQPKDSGGAGLLSNAGPERIHSAWQVWLRALANDAEAALGAALAYESLDQAGRDAFLDALDEDAANLGVPRVALFAPFLSVEKSPARRNRIRLALGDDFGTAQRRRPSSLLGIAPNGDRIAVVIAPMYLEFVRVIQCRFSRTEGFRWIRNDPLLHINDAPVSGTILDGTSLERAPLATVIDEIASAVVSQRDPQGKLPSALDPLLELFDARLREPCDTEPSAP